MLVPRAGIPHDPQSGANRANPIGHRFMMAYSVSLSSQRSQQVFGSVSGHAIWMEQGQRIYQPSHAKPEAFRKSILRLLYSKSIEATLYPSSCLRVTYAVTFGVFLVYMFSNISKYLEFTAIRSLLGVNLHAVDILQGNARVPSFGHTSLSWEHLDQGIVTVEREIVTPWEQQNLRWGDSLRSWSSGFKA